MMKKNYIWSKNILCGRKREKKKKVEKIKEEKEEKERKKKNNNKEKQYTAVSIEDICIIIFREIGRL